MLWLLGKKVPNTFWSDNFGVFFKSKRRRGRGRERNNRTNTLKSNPSLLGNLNKQEKKREKERPETDRTTTTTSCEVDRKFEPANLFSRVKNENRSEKRGGEKMKENASLKCDSSVFGACVWDVALFSVFFPFHSLSPSL